MVSPVGGYFCKPNMQPARFYCTLLIALISVANGLAQGISFGPTYEYETRKNFAEFINQTEGNIYLLRCRNPYYEGNIYIEKYDNALNLVSTETIKAIHLEKVIL